MKLTLKSYGWIYKIMLRLRFIKPKVERSQFWQFWQIRHKEFWRLIPKGLRLVFLFVFEVWIGNSS